MSLAPEATRPEPVIAALSEVLVACKLRLSSDTVPNFKAGDKSNSLRFMP